MAIITDPGGVVSVSAGRANTQHADLRVGGRVEFEAKPRTDGHFSDFSNSPE